MFDEAAQLLLLKYHNFGIKLLSLNIIKAESCHEPWEEEADTRRMPSADVHIGWLAAVATPLARAHTHEITYVVEDVVVVDSDADATDSSGIHAKTSHILNYILMTLFVSSSVTSTAVKTLHINNKKKGYNVSSKSIISQCLPA